MIKTRMILLALTSLTGLLAIPVAAQSQRFSTTERAIGTTAKDWSFMTAWHLDTGGQQVSPSWYNGNSTWSYYQPFRNSWVAKFIYRASVGQTRELQWSYTQAHVQYPIPAGKVLRHPPTGKNPYAFYTYFPKSLEALGAMSLCVWPHGGGASSYDYAYHEAMASNQLNRLIEFSERYRVPILVAAIPRVNEIYVHSLHPNTFTTTDAFLYRPDLKLIDAAWNQYIPFLESFGCKVSNKVLMMGYSSPGMFAHRFAMFHPDLVKAVWLGGEAPAPVCANEMYGTNLEYPVGTYNWESLVGEPFQYNTYKNIPHLVTVGGSDTNAINDTTSYTDIFTESQRLFIRSHFGDTNPKRIKFYADHLSATNVPTIFVQYDGVGHACTTKMLDDAFKFLTSRQ